MKIAPLVALGLIVGMAGCNDDKYTGKVKDAEDMEACFLKAFQAEILYKQKLGLTSSPINIEDLQVSERLEQLAKGTAADTIALYERMKERGIPLDEMLQNLEAQAIIAIAKGEGTFMISCIEGYLTQKKVKWPNY